MFKRTKGYFLLTMLVLTGLAGRIHSDTLTTKERRYLATELKSTRVDFINSIKGLSEKQLKFKPGKNQQSVRDCIYKMVAAEKSLWTTAKSALKQEPSSLQRTMINDETLVTLVQQPSDSHFNEIKFKTVKEALKLYKSDRQEMLKYVNTSTENVRAHIGQTNGRNFDAYQLMLLNTIYCKYYTQKIEKIKATPGFPK